VLIDCVEGGASVSFMAPLSQERADGFWQGVAEGVAAGERILLVAEDRAGGIVGTVQVVLRQPENQPHRADISKMLVHRRARRQGIGAALMQGAEDAARGAGKTVLVLDTVTGSDGERLLRTPRLAAGGRHPELRPVAPGRVVRHHLFPQADFLGLRGAPQKSGVAPPLDP
jgi:GNAT superfamily N-acetyltransferase